MTATEIWQEAFPLLTILVVVFGGCIGSFLNVVVWRLPRGESLSHPPSRCPTCGHAIRPWENIPVLSWLCLAGRCSSCRLPISWRYPAVELLTAVLFWRVWLRVAARGDHPTALLGLFFLTGALLAVALIDLEHRIVPNTITYAGMVVGLASAAWLPASHPLPLSSSMGPGGGYLVWEALLPWLPPPAVSARWLPLADAATGLLLGGLCLWLLRVALTPFLGVRRPKLAPNGSARLDGQGLTLDGGQSFAWPELLQANLLLRNPQIVLAGDGELPAVDENGDLPLTVRRGVVQAGNWRLPLAEVDSLRGEIVSLRVVRDILGWGDIKLLAMIGALLGAEALPFVLVLAAGAGVLLGSLAWLCSANCRRQGVPFAPFVALGAWLWVMRGPELLAWYQRLLPGGAAPPPGW